MKKIHSYLLVLVLLSLTLNLSAKTRKTVFIILDGIPADVIERLDPPAISEISRRGGYARAYMGGTPGTYNETPTISAVGYNCLLTGTWANKHNVWDNDPAPNYNYWSVFRIAKEQKKPVTTAVFSSWTDNRTKLLGEGLPETGCLKIDYVADGLDLDEKNYPKEANDLHIFKIDEKISETAAGCIRENAPDLSWVYLWYTDDAGHIWGNGDFFDEYTMKADAQVARVWEAVKYREAHFDEEWMIVVTTDHGRGADGHHHGGQSDRERTTWIATNVAPNAHFTTDRLAITDITPTVCRYMRFAIPRPVAWEQDGIPFIGNTDVAALSVEDTGGKIRLSWDSFRDKVPVTVYGAAKNLYKEGGTDTWVRIGKAKAGDRVFVLDPEKYPSGFCKFVIATPDNHLNCWYK